MMRLFVSALMMIGIGVPQLVFAQLGGGDPPAVGDCMTWTGVNERCVWIAFPDVHDIPCPTDPSACSGNDIHVSNDEWPGTKSGEHPAASAVEHDCKVTCPCIVRYFNLIPFCGPDTSNCTKKKGYEFYLNSDVMCPEVVGGDE